MNRCKKCGACCRALLLPYTMEEIETVASENTDSPDFLFAAEHFHPITEEQAVELNPYLKIWGFAQYNAFTCDMFNAEKNICNCYEDRPEICKGYPWYGDVPRLQHFYAEDCGYRDLLKSIVKTKRNISRARGTIKRMQKLLNKGR